MPNLCLELLNAWTKLTFLFPIFIDNFPNFIYDFGNKNQEEAFMKKIILVIFFLSLLSPVSWAKVGDILKVIKTPGPCPTGLAFDGQEKIS